MVFFSVAHIVQSVEGRPFHWFVSRQIVWDSLSQNMQLVCNHFSKKLHQICLFDWILNMHNQPANNGMNITHLLSEIFNTVIYFLPKTLLQKEAIF